MKKDKKEKQMAWVIFFMIFIIAVLLGTYFMVNSQKSFTYRGLKFFKEDFGKLKLYRYTYHFNDQSGSPITYNFYVRNDPRKNNVPVNGTIGPFPADSIYISINSSAFYNCSDSTIAVAGLASFLKDNMIGIAAATPDKEESDLKGTQYVTCQTNRNDAVLLINGGNKTEIVRNKQCYAVTIANCDILKALEKFEINAIIDAKNQTTMKLNLPSLSS